MAVPGVRMGARFLETVAWVTLYAGFGIFALTYDGTSDMYRSIFLEGTATDWLPGASRRYEPPDVVRGGEVSPYFASGWWPLNAQGIRWGSTERSVLIVVPNRDLPVGSRIVGRIGGLVGGTKLHETVSVAVNNTEVVRLVLDDPQTRPFDVPLPFALDAGEAVEIAFRVPHARSPMLVLAFDNSREFGVRFEELALIPPSLP